MQLDGKVAVITGGTAGIGKSIALSFAKAGASVIILGTNASRAEDVLRELQGVAKNSLQKFSSYLVDISKTADVLETMTKILQEFAKIDVLVNNAGITKDNLLLKMTEEDWDTVLDVNLKSVYNTCKAVVRSMIKARSGSIINISSVIGITGNAGQVNYAASKAGMIGVTKSLAKELASRFIRVNCVAPGYIETQMTQTLPPSVKDSILSKIPLGMIGKPEDVAEVCVFLASDLSSYITGQVIAVDGGMVM